MSAADANLGPPRRRGHPPVSSMSLTAFTVSMPAAVTDNLAGTVTKGASVALPSRRRRRVDQHRRLLRQVDSKGKFPDNLPDFNLPDMSKVREKLDSFDMRGKASDFGKKHFLAASFIAACTIGGVDMFKFLRGLSGSWKTRWNSLVQGGPEDDGTLGATASEPTVIYDVRGRVVATLSGEAVPLSEVSDYAWQAVVASEDRRFFAHYGVDVRGISRAVLSAGKQGGGSTITQQLVKNMLLSHDRTISRKVVEMASALVLETKVPKPRLLESYLNNVYWGHGVYGIAGASAAYFRKRPSELTVGEGAMLAGLLPAPEWLSPYRNRAGALKARANVLQRMAAAGYIEEAEAAREMNAPLPAGLALSPGSSGPSSAHSGDSLRGAPYKAPFFVSEVLYQLQELCGDEVMTGRGGLQIYTTLDLGLQERAEQLLKEDGEELMNGESKGEAALVAMEPGTGAVRVLVGGRNYAHSSYNRAVSARRSPGSAFKPVVYLAALGEMGITPSLELDDEEVIFKKKGHNKWIEIAKNKSAHTAKVDPEELLSAESGEGDEYEYRPQNYSRKYRGMVSLRDALADSLNIPTVKLCNMIGVDKTIEMARKLGVKSELPNTLSLSLGACEVTPLEIACVYNTIAAKGVYSRPHLVTRVKDRSGMMVYRHKTMRRKAASESSCEDLHRMLRAAVTRGTGRAAASGWPSTAAAGKTGTSDDYRDAWFAGYSPAMACVVWIGRDDNGSLPGSGSTLAAPLWARFMRAAQGSGVPAEKGNKKRRTPRWSHF